MGLSIAVRNEDSEGERVLLFTIRCDGEKCNDTQGLFQDVGFIFERASKSYVDVRHAAYVAGWVRTESKWFCPICARARA